jgi:hypothetical protein
MAPSFCYQTGTIWLDAKLDDTRAIGMQGSILLFDTPSIALAASFAVGML